MPRPAVVIGLGGTGQWVLTWLKRDLLLSNNGKMPNNVKLLEIDTATKLEAGTTRVVGKSEKEESIQVGDVALEPGEFIYLGGEARQLAQQVKDKQYPQIDSWFRAERWLNDLPTTSFTLDDGAGRLRQFGRLAIFKDVLKEETGSIIYRALRTAISSVLNVTDEQRKLEIIVVGSFAGGTGSGLFIDVALLLRRMAQELQAHHILRGMFALPNVFTTSPDDEMLARSFAAWRELNRFMVINPDFPMPLIRYVQDSAMFKTTPTQRLFDACYLVDGRRGEQMMAADAKYGAFPAMSEAISAVLDEEAGTKYTQWILTNLAPEYSKRPDIPMYSAIGAYSLQVPAYFVENQATHLYAQQILLKLLAPSIQPDEHGHLVARGANRHLALAAPDKNLEDKGFAGRTRSRRLFTERTVYQSDQVAPVTLFFGRVAQVLEEAITAQRRQALIEGMARAGGADSKQTASRESWLTSYPNFGDDPRLAELRKQVSDHTGYNAIRNFGRREGQKEEEARAQLRKIPNDVREKFGGMTASGQEAEEFYGTFGDVLEQCHTTHMAFFRQVVRVNLLRILMGDSADKPLLARSGKLGYAWDYFDGAVSELSDFLKLMEDVRRRREELKPELKILGLSENAKRYLNETSGKKLFWLWEDPKVKGAEDSFLQAQQRALDLRREDIFHSFVVRTAREMQELCVDVRNSIQRWVLHLTTGDDASNMPGLWDEVQKGMQRIKNAHSFDTSIPKVQGLVSDSEISVSEEGVADALRHWIWDISIDKNTSAIKIDAHIELPDSSTTSFADPGSLFETNGRPLELAQNNRATLLDLASRESAGIIKRATVVEQIKRKYSAAELVTLVGDKAEPLFSGSGGPRKRSNLIRVQVAPNDAFFEGKDGIEGLLRKRNSLEADRRDDTYSIQIVGSENPYKFTMVRTDDLYTYDQFAAWKECRKGYANHFLAEGKWLDPTLMHIFPAEAQAVTYEKLEYKKNHIYKELHPRVVMFLEDIRALRQFLYLFGLGKIAEVDAETYRWELQLDRGENIWLTPGWVSSDQAIRAKPDLLNAVHGFVIVKSNQSSYNKKPINYNAVQKNIEAEITNLGGTDVEKEFLEQMSREDDPNSILSVLVNQAGVSSRDQLEIERKDYADLIRVTGMIFAERIAEIDKLKSGGRMPRFVPKPKTSD